MRWLALGAGAVLVAVAFLAASHVANTREGLISEVITLLAALIGVSLLLYGLVATLSSSRSSAPAPTTVTKVSEQVHNAAELVIGGIGILVAATLLVGIAVTASALWALLGAVLLLPMIAGCSYLCFAFARGPRRDWKVDLQKVVRRN
jgi:hypothetical protein